ncbi:MAG: UDP-N-acetyl glucosamine 2-epimerase [Paludibacteraceae bacterium]|nr:UDP-N-acetyl glucosamine 2-epimerase [Paludibacteraceae bacterium]
MNITLIAGARPNFMKIAPLIKAIEQFNEQKVESGMSRVESQEWKGESQEISYRLVHTGQHYDKNMSDTFFEELGISAPDTNLGCGGGTQAEQTAAIMVAFEKELIAHPADVVLVVGDVTSTMACSIVAKKLNTRVCHVEAGIRSWDLSMPEEINRMVTDSLADYMFTTSEVANRNLQRMGATMMEKPTPSPSLKGGEECTVYGVGCKVESVGLAEDKYAYERVPQRVWYVGNVMIDTLLANRARFRQPEVWNTLALKEKQYIVMTMHRPANVDEENHLRAMMEQIVDNAHGLPIVFPIHPRTAKLFYNLWKPTPSPSLKGGEECTVYGVECKEGEELAKRFPNLHIVEPLGYLEFNYLVERAKAVVTDSGGITEETTVMGVPCITLRDNTERPETCTVGTNELIGTNPAAIKPALDKLFAGEWKKGGVPALWDGHAAERIIAILAGIDVRC